MASYAKDEKTLSLWDSLEPEETIRVKRKKKREVVLENLKTGRRYSCSIQSKVILGRDGARCNLKLTDSDGYMSGVHMMLILHNDRLYVEDMGSTNGTYLNHMRIDKREEISVNDMLKLGHSEFRLVRFS